MTLWAIASSEKPQAFQRSARTRISSFQYRLAVSPLRLFRLRAIRSISFRQRSTGNIKTVVIVRILLPACRRCSRLHRRAVQNPKCQIRGHPEAKRQGRLICALLSFCLLPGSEPAQWQAISTRWFARTRDASIRFGFPVRKTLSLLIKRRIVSWR